MLPELSDDGAPPAPAFSESRALRSLRHRVALLLLTFSVVILPNLLSYAASVVGD